MKPVRLTIQAFGPYPAREVIDFREAIETGLFGIYGQTGAGKSTIFSAMTFALFGVPAKEEQENSSLRSDHADAKLQTEVEFVFDIGTRRYVVLRRPDQMRPRKHGDGETKLAHEAFLFDATGLSLDEISESDRGVIIAEKKVSAVNPAVAELLGYGPEQFRQIVLLPQGKFETFLAAKTKDRLEILRDLFDVALYRNLASKLKADAQAAEEAVQRDRAVCAARLSSEGYESTEALLDGIESASADHEELLGRETLCRQAVDSAQHTLNRAEKLESQFKSADDARDALDAIRSDAELIASLVEQIRQAESAYYLLDVENNVTIAAGEIREADQAVKSTSSVFDEAKKTAERAIGLLQTENARVNEIEVMRRTVDELARHQETLARSRRFYEELKSANDRESQAKMSHGEALSQLTQLQNRQRQKTESLDQEKQNAGRRQGLKLQQAEIITALKAASTIEKADDGIRTATEAVNRLNASHDKFAAVELKAKAQYENAEQQLSAVQALHLASKLSDGDPCPVCGATHHPNPANGTAENAGLDRIFRDTKTAWQHARDDKQASSQKLAEAQSVLNERQSQLTGLERPEKSAAALQGELRKIEDSLKGLGTEIDLAAEEAEIGRLGEEIQKTERVASDRRDTLEGARTATAAASARLAEMISGVPEQFLDPGTLADAHSEAVSALNIRQAGFAAANEAVNVANLNVVSKQKDFEAAEGVLSASRNRHTKAVETFQARLEQAGFAANDFQLIKPAIVSLEQDRLRVEAHRRNLDRAEVALQNAEAAITDQVRPDLMIAKAKLTESNDNLRIATDLRSGAKHRLDHLKSLHHELSETIRRLDEAEAESGPLRQMAAIFDGKNLLRLDLETYAIGAMFDQVLEAANLRLRPMTANRYWLERELEGGGNGRRGLGIQVFDSFTGKARPTSTLSGGEGFISALALALGLADVVESTNGKVRLDTIFIDEGFGSLDTENDSGTLDQVLNALSSLVRQNRAVGLISHVPLVQETIPNGFYVRKNATGSSTIETRGVI